MFVSRCNSLPSSAKADLYIRNRRCILHLECLAEGAVGACSDDRGIARYFERPVCTPLEGFAIRLALGAAPRQIMGWVLTSAVKLAASGLAIGLTLAFPAGRINLLPPGIQVRPAHDRIRGPSLVKQPSYLACTEPTENCPPLAWQTSQASPIEFRFVAK